MRAAALCRLGPTSAVQYNSDPVHKRISSKSVTKLTENMTSSTFLPKYISCNCARVVQIFDPLGLSEGAGPGEIKKWREAEIKHGRVAMLACLGVLVAEVRVPPSVLQSTATILFAYFSTCPECPPVIPQNSTVRTGIFFCGSTVQ